MKEKDERKRNIIPRMNGIIKKLDCVLIITGIFKYYYGAQKAKTFFRCCWVLYKLCLVYTIVVWRWPK